MSGADSKQLLHVERPRVFGLFRLFRSPHSRGTPYRVLEKETIPGKDFANKIWAIQ